MGLTQRLDQLKSPILKLRLPSYKKTTKKNNKKNTISYKFIGELKDQETPTNTSHPKKSQKHKEKQETVINIMCDRISK